jgi:hypothetical protein
MLPSNAVLPELAVLSVGPEGGCERVDTTLKSIGQLMKA